VVSKNSRWSLLQKKQKRNGKNGCFLAFFPPFFAAYKKIDLPLLCIV